MGELNEHTSDFWTSKKRPWVSVCMLESMVSAGSFCRRHRILARMKIWDVYESNPHSPRPRDTNSPVSSWNVNWAPWDLCGILGFGMLHLTFGFSGCKKIWLWSMNRNEIEGDPLALGSPMDPIEKVALLDLLLEPLTNHSRRSSSIFKHTNGSPSRSIQTTVDCFSVNQLLCPNSCLPGHQDVEAQPSEHQHLGLAKKHQVLKLSTTFEKKQLSSIMIEKGLKKQYNFHPLCKKKLAKMTWMPPKSIPMCQEEKNWQKKHNPNPLSRCHCKPRSKKHLSFFPPFHPFSSKSKWPFQSWHAGSRPTWPFQAQQWSSHATKSSWRPSRRNTLPRLRPFHQKLCWIFSQWIYEFG